MRITGLVIYPEHGADSEASVRHDLAGRGGFEAGESVGGHRIAAVLESPDAASERAELDWLKQHTGVRMVSVAYAWFGDDTATPHHEEARS